MRPTIEEMRIIVEDYYSKPYKRAHDFFESLSDEAIKDLFDKMYQLDREIKNHQEKKRAQIVLSVIK